jgi:hypothetical protein
MTSPAPRDGVFVMWHIPAPDAAALRAVVADVLVTALREERARLGERLRDL